ncbi:hypothetical protein E3N88_01025 [Mikania micrantha]|uniref:Uncharacterized protein n=1 Tax=Mikania micrantha TaxID=192012 RepID=A0A5N6PZV0_9ASTR|nr:hypothetical protein E3N88_01025 [Mikania micrantha]
MDQNMKMGQIGPDIGSRRLGRSRKAHKILSPPSPLLALVEEKFQELKSCSIIISTHSKLWKVDLETM